MINDTSRGLMVVDAHLDQLPQELSHRNIIPLSTSVPTDDQSRELILPRRIFVTGRSTDFLDDATSFEYSIVATEAISMNAKDLAAIISKAVIDHGLWSLPFGWILRLQPAGKHELVHLLR
jgi:hypothetical protein